MAIQKEVVLPGGLTANYHKLIEIRVPLVPRDDGQYIFDLVVDLYKDKATRDLDKAVIASGEGDVIGPAMNTQRHRVIGQSVDADLNLIELAYEGLKIGPLDGGTDLL